MNRLTRIVPAVSAALLVAAVAVPGGALAAASAKPVVVTVIMTDFTYKLSRDTVPAGQVVTYKVINKGRSAHNFDINGSKGSPFLAPGKSFTLKVALKPGEWSFVCTVPRHAELGMRGDLTAK